VVMRIRAAIKAIVSLLTNDIIFSLP